MNKANPPDTLQRLRNTAVAVANLGTGKLGVIACVNNGNAGLAWGDTVTGGGSAEYLVWWNGAAWKVIGK
jgi:hypothetical protein